MRTLSHQAARRVYDRFVSNFVFELLPFLEAGRWRVRHHLPLAPYGLPSKAVVAECPRSAKG